MIAAILWKEYREHRMVWAALALAGAALLVGLPFVMAPGGLHDRPEVRWMLCAAAVGLTWLYGLVCGAMLLAGERETGTLPFLDALPGLRRRLWLAKCAAGVALVLGQVAFLMGVAAVARIFEDWATPAWTLGGMVYFGLFGFAWGLLFSSFGRSVMNLILMSFFGQVMAVWLASGVAASLTVLSSAVLGVPPAGNEGWYPWVLMAAIIVFSAPAALAGSALVFTRLDRRRRLRPAVPSRAKPVKPRRPPGAWSALFWLTWRQARGFAAGLALFALLLGAFVPTQGVLLWPAATLLLGVLCGATTFAGEQEGPYRFLGDQRFPLGRLWLVKVGIRFAIAVAAAVLVLAPSFFIALANTLALEQSHGGASSFLGAFEFYLFHSSLVLVIPPLLYLTVWLFSGFAVGCLCGLLFRNGLPAGVLALFTGALLTAVWVPSMLGGGLHAWQALGPPVLLLLSTLLLLRPWAAGRIASWTTAVRLTPFVVLALLWIAGGLWYRVLEILYVPEKADLDAFRASLPTPEHNEGGELDRRACLRFLNLRLPDIAKRPDDPPMWRARDVLDRGWNRDDADLAAWLDKLFADEWVGMLKKSADLPLGTFDDLRNLTENSLLPATQTARDVAVVLAVRGLQRQADGDDEAYVEYLRIGLNLSQTMRHRALPIDVLLGRAVEVDLIKGLDRWLEKLHGRSDLIQKALGVLSDYAAATADDLKDQRLADDLIITNTADDPLAVMEVYLRDQPWWPGRNDPNVQTEARWMQMAWLVPWEQERHNRILRVIYWGNDKDRRQLFGRWHWVGPLAQLGPYAPHKPMTPMQQCGERAMLLKLALRWYQADHGKPADKLDELVPKYLSSIPHDPFDGQPFHYRLSKGEEIEWPEPPDAAGVAAPAAAPPGGPGGMAAPPPAVRKIAAGQGILWSVGGDRLDDGGHRQSRSLDGTTAAGEDVIFLVPLPPKE